jgi:hypothetical protein
MAVYERDFIMRVLKQLVEALARALGLAKEGKVQEARVGLEETCLALLGMEYQTLALVDAATAAQLLGDPARVFVFARVVVGLADVAREARDAAAERRHCVHASELVQQVLARTPGHAEAKALLGALALRLQGL